MDRVDSNTQFRPSWPVLPHLGIVKDFCFRGIWFETQNWLASPILKSDSSGWRHNSVFASKSLQKNKSKQNKKIFNQIVCLLPRKISKFMICEAIVTSLSHRAVVWKRDGTTSASESWALGTDSQVMLSTQLPPTHLRVVTTGGSKGHHKALGASQVRHLQVQVQVYEVQR